VIAASPDRSLVAGPARDELLPVSYVPAPQEKNMPIVTIQQGPRSVELKRELVKQVTDAFVNSLAIPAEAVQVWIHEVPTDSWGAAGKLTADN
jgi:4-oxalocrotonate tautomerase